MKYCVKCGHELAEGAKFCPACGTPVATTQSSATDESTTQNQSAPATNVSETVNAESVKESQTGNSNSEGAQSQPQLGFVGSIQYILKHMFEFNGNVPESRKSVFWWGYLGLVIFCIVVMFIPVVGAILVTLSRVLLISAAMRRLTYINQNTGLAWLLIIPVVELYVYFLMILDKKEG
ncbi:zinc-ribbon domain-containing protein [Levilactobacillus parabrevis]|uniref:zinc-ribbon domain-containing protein n=1 Tax=Levilactobacillus parabrevis TaxID=357278 RepID=UPI00035CEE38|nr:zinc-ribbon domain-containing protein [Levilactobacillus parabrevis]